MISDPDHPDADHVEVGPIQAVTTVTACHKGGAKSDRHNDTPRPSRVGPFQAVILGPIQAVIAMTTLRGPQFPIYLVGARMIASYEFTPFTQRNGLMHSAFSYCGRVLVSINGCPVVLPDIERYGDCMDDSFAELLGREDLTTAPKQEPSSTRAGIGVRAE